jgi:hypothetical protein
MESTDSASRSPEDARFPVLHPTDTTGREILSALAVGIEGIHGKDSP